MGKKHNSVATCAKGKPRSSKKRIGTRGATFKDAPRPKSSVMPRMVRSYVEPVAPRPVESMDTGATSLSFESPEPVRREVPAPKCVGLRQHVCDDPRACIWIIDGMNPENDRPRRGWWIGAGWARKLDQRKLSRRYEAGRSDKASIGKTRPTTDRMPVIEPVPKQYR